MFTTHVGSMPLDYSPENVRRAFSDMASLGLDYPPVPQLRSFIDMYMEPLRRAGAVRREGARYLAGELGAVPEEAGIPELDHLSWAVGETFKGLGVRFCVTGPFTLASNILLKPGGSPLLDSVLKLKRFVLETLTEYVSSFVREASERGAEMVVVDEPILTVMVGRRILFGYTAEELSTALDRLFDGVGCRFRGVHACYIVPPTLSRILLSCERLNYLDHEFADSPANIDAYTGEELESHGKLLGMGVVSSKSIRVEDRGVVESRIRLLLDRFGRSLAFVKPDCGFGGFKGMLSSREDEYTVALRKLRVLVEAARLYSP